MKAILLINLSSLLNTFICLITAFILGGLVGFERQYRQRTAGLRTNVLVAIGAAVFVNMAGNYGTEGVARVVSYVVSGVGFLGAGVIMREEGNVRGINTAATLWGAAAIGACAGAHLILEAIMATLFVLAANTLLRPVVHAINRRPFDMEAIETTIEIHMITEKEQQKEALSLLKAELKANHYFISDMDIHTFGENEVEIELILTTESANSTNLDELIQRISGLTMIKQAFWSPSFRD
ncbi:MgtC/SapB family protein [Neisseria sp. Ec49-e6-T10]|uniref:MgtC/SapB family protein n=1 Tax=Neisseria sp. Ec49-e6-T10 TaxID=3140744 RepID=UPI003EB7F9F0